VIGCGGKSDAATAMTTGSVGGHTLSVAATQGYTVPYEPALDDGGIANGATLEVFLASRSETTCAASAQGQRFANDTSLLLEIRSSDAIVPGMYPLTESASQAFFEALGPSCGMIESATATSGTITLTEVTSTVSSGSFALTFGDAGTLTGSFSNVAQCAATQGAATESCVP
jgi:hypothetical protein